MSDVPGLLGLDEHEYRAFILDRIRFVASFSGRSLVVEAADVIEWLVPVMQRDGHTEAFIEEVVGDICDVVGHVAQGDEKLRIEHLVPGGILPTDYVHHVTNDGTCSRCRQPIGDDEVPIQLFIGDGTDMYSFCEACTDAA